MRRLRRHFRSNSRGFRSSTRPLPKADHRPPTEDDEGYEGTPWAIAKGGSDCVGARIVEGGNFHEGLDDQDEEVQVKAKPPRRSRSQSAIRQRDA